MLMNVVSFVFTNIEIYLFLILCYIDWLIDYMEFKRRIGNISAI